MSVDLIQKHLDLLGRKATDRVTGMQGVVTTVCFDLFGCIQASINPGLDKDGKPRETHWYDVSRIAVDGNDPVMKRPDFVQGEMAEGRHGPAEKPRASG